jgi:hypothetical protein
LGGFHDSFDAIARRELCLDAIETPPPSSAVPALAAVLDKSLSVVTSTAAGAIAHQRERVRSLLNQLNCELSKQTEGAFRTLQMNEEKRVASQRHSFEKELALVKSAGLAEIESAKQRDAAMTTAKSRIELKVLTSQIEELEQSLREARTGSSAKMEELTYQLEAANRGMVEARSTAAAAVEEAEEARPRQVEDHRLPLPHSFPWRPSVVSSRCCRVAIPTTRGDAESRAATRCGTWSGPRYWRWSISPATSTSRASAPHCWTGRRSSGAAAPGAA